MPPDETVDLSDMSPTRRFSDRAEDYRRFRPDYPQAAFAAILEGLDPSRLVAADVGAGTGISARPLAARGSRVIAIEPNAEMRNAAEPHPHVEWRDGTAEATGLTDSSVDLVLCAQAFHWFRAREALVEFHRVLAPGGRLTLMWNKRDRDDPLTRGYIEAIHAVNGEHPIEKMPFDPTTIAASGLFTEARVQSFSHSQSLDLEGFIGRAVSASYVPKDGEGLERLRAILSALWEQKRNERGMVTMRYVTEVYLAQRR